MALHPAFPASPYDPLLPAHRWFPADESLRSLAYEKLLPPLVAKIRSEVHAWCAEATMADAAQTPPVRNDFVFVDQGGFEKHRPATFADYKS